VITIRNVDKTFNDGETKRSIVTNFSLEVREGEFISIMGPSGCGKSTLLNLIAGTEKVDKGEIFINGTDITALSEANMTKFRLNHMGFIFQNYHLIPVLNCLDNVSLPLIAKGVSEKEAARRAKDVLDELGLGSMLHKYPAKLSGGQNQRVSIARAIVGSPQIILADEPTGALDPDNTKMIVNLLHQINKDKLTTIIMVTHNESIAEETDRIIKLG